MAKKKITIPGGSEQSPLLTNLNQPWGGIATDATTIHGIPVPAGREWGINRGEVERFIKAQLRTLAAGGTKIGAFRFSTAPDANNFYHLWGFASAADRDAYVSDPSENASLLLYDVILPISTVQTDSYVARLYANRDGVTSYVIKDGDAFNIGLRFSAIHLIAATSEQESMAGNGTLTIDRSTNGQQTWTQVGSVQIASVSADTEGYPVTLNLGPYLSAGRDNVIRLRASFRYTNELDEETTMQSSNIIVNVTSATLAVKMMTDWTRPVMASENAFPLSFAVTGAVEKWLHVTVQGSLGTYTYAERMTAQTEYPETSPHAWTESERNTIGLLTHGVHKVTAWVTCDDGSGHTDADGRPDSISSDVIEHQLMVVNANATAEELARPRLMLQNVKTTAMNYVRTVLADYAVWIPDTMNPLVASSDTLPASIRITDAAENDTDYTTAYAQEEYTGTNGLRSGIAYHIDTAVEIENPSNGQQVSEYLAYLRIFRYDGNGDAVNMMYESLRQRFITLTIDNSENYAPTSGAWFVLNPRNRNNTDENRASIINAQTGLAVTSSGWGAFGFVSDGWVTADDGQKVLRVLAGEQIEIDIDPWEQFIGSDVNAINSQMTFEVDFAIRNITQEDEAAIDITQEVDGETMGLRMYPLEGFIMSSERQKVNDQDFAWEEGKRTHLAATVHPAVVTRAAGEMEWMIPTNNATSQPLPLAKIYINGFPERDVDYVVKEASWGAGNGKKIVIGNPHADIDIYGIRIYHTALSGTQVVQDVKASLPTAEEKLALKNRNDITTSGHIDYEKARDKGYRCLTWVGQDQYKTNQDKNTGYAGYWRIDNDDPAFSGTIGKAAYLAYKAGTIGNKKCLMITAQGSTANTYWENNGQTKLDKVSYVVNILFSKVHSDFGWKAAMSTGDSCSNPMYLDGNRIEGTAYASLTDEEKARVTINVIDGWFDGNGWNENMALCGMYHGQFYTCYEGGPKCTKLVNKINYASPMQSHKMGATRLYNDVMKAVLSGGMQLHKDHPEVRFSVYEESFLYFMEHPDENNNYTTEFHGMGTFGFGKFDKVTFGVKQDGRTFGFEGLNNNLPLCDFRVPADDDVIYNPADEAWCYNGVKSMEYGLGKTETRVDGQGNTIKNGEDDAEFPKAANEAIFRRYVNFIYSHCTSLRYYNGTRQQFETWYNNLVAQAEANPTGTAKDTLEDAQKHQYWFTSGLTQVRFDFVRDEWVDAGTWNQSNEINGRAAMSYAAGVRKLDEYYMTAAAYEAWRTGENYGDWSALNTAFRHAYAEHFANYFGTVGHVKNHQTHYNLVNFLFAGTDNCSKNLYYQYDPDSGLIFMDQDDLDTIFKTDNNGRQTKVYFLDRIHDAADYEAGYKLQIDYEGRGSLLFNALEAAYEETSNGLRQNMREVLKAMASLVGTGEGYDQSVMGCLEKYFLSVQSYFPQVAYQEQARIRYEYPKSFGYISFGNQARGIDPITQQIGSQQESERQYMKRRLALVASYACWGDFSGGVNTGVVGLADSGSALSLTPGSGNTGGVYAFDVVPHQWIYPVGVVGRTAADPHVRVAPGETYHLTVARSGEISGDSSVGLVALNYYRKIGNLGDMVVGNNTLSVVANRLTEFVAEPTDTENPAFQPGTISLSTPNLQRLSLKGVNTMRGAKDFSSLRRCEYIDIRGTNITVPQIPVSQSLATLRLPATITSLSLAGLPSLGELSFEGYSALRSFSLDESVTQINTQQIMEAMYYADAPLQTLTLPNVAWPQTGYTTPAPQLVDWMASRATANVTGAIALPEGAAVAAALRVTFDMKMRWLKKWGAIDSSGNPLYITYQVYTTGNIVIRGPKVARQTGDIEYVVTSTNSTLNDFTGVTWAIGNEANGYAAFASADNGVLTVTQLGDESRNIIPTANITAVMSTIAGGTRSADPYKVYLYERSAHVSDIVYADGSYSPGDEVDTTRSPIGICFWVNPDDPTDRRMVALDDIKIGSTYQSIVWGLYNDATNGFTGLAFQDEERKSYSRENNYAGSVYDLPMINITSYNLSYVDAGGTTIARNYATDDVMLDPNNDVADRFDTGPDYYIGVKRWPIDLQSVQSLSSSSLMETFGTMPLPESFSLGGTDQDESYTAGTRMPIGKIRTLQIIRHRNEILSDSGFVNAYGTRIPEADPANGITETDDLIAQMAALVEAGNGDTKLRQYYYPAASYCYAYEPTLVAARADTLADKFKAHNWYLPSIGELAYMWFMDNHSKGSEEDEHSGFFKARHAAIQFQGFAATYYWSSTEYNAINAWLLYAISGRIFNTFKYNGYRVRPVSAF